MNPADVLRYVAAPLIVLFGIVILCFPARALPFKAALGDRGSVVFARWMSAFAVIAGAALYFFGPKYL